MPRSRDHDWRELFNRRAALYNYSDHPFQRNPSARPELSITTMYYLFLSLRGRFDSEGFGALG